MSCKKCNQNQNQSNIQILPEGTEETYAELIDNISKSVNIVNWNALMEFKKVVDNRDYIKARELLVSLSEEFNNTSVAIVESIQAISTSIANCLALPIPKGSIEFNSYVKKTYQSPTDCKCATCKYCVTTELQEGVLLIKKYACNYENNLTEAKHSGNYNKYDIFDQLSVDRDGVCSCYEFGDTIDYEEIPNVVEEDTIE